MEDIPRETIEQAQTGDRQAFERIYRAASGFVYNVALRILNDRDEAQEVAQEVFIKMYHHLKEFGFRSSFKTWAYRITVNTALNAAKRITRDTSRRLDFDTVMETQAAPQDTQKEIVRQEERQLSRERLRALLSKLNPEQRACIVLREIEGLSYEEISRALAININTVRSRLKRAREALLALSGGGR